MFILSVLTVSTKKRYVRAIRRQMKIRNSEGEVVIQGKLKIGIENIVTELWPMLLELNKNHQFHKCLRLKIHQDTRERFDKTWNKKLHLYPAGPIHVYDSYGMLWDFVSRFVLNVDGWEEVEGNGETVSFAVFDDHRCKYAIPEWLDEIVYEVTGWWQSDIAYLESQKMKTFPEIAQILRDGIKEKAK